MNSKKHLAASIALVMSVSLCQPAFAGVPTVSVAELAQLVQNAQQQAQQALAQLEKAKEAIQQAKSQYEHYKSIMEGNDKLGSFLNDPYVNQLLPARDWQDIYNQTQDLTDLRKRYGVSGYEPEVQKVFDKLLRQAGVLEEQYKATNIRKKNAETLRNKLNEVQTPAEREQLVLRYQQEQLELANQQTQLQNTRYLMEQQEKLEQKKKEQNFVDYMLGKSKVRPE
ncbi:conjugal transfer protein [Salmonella enterica subsp. enterica serovar Fluntern]|uniref:Conjugal transfer protein n=2 Tax=Salmonella enterica TaxID=28901 RepID=A0A744QDS6_SALER|nr:type IV secretion system protein [Salmonella enterica]EAA1887998.1 conjugal transfer protein [Salmonella enterica subsp. enterica serovar Fluntern]EAA7909018.1 conjugal transfer protein [Salmonella enterica subsp. enterica serovar Cerro]EBG5746436.1 conjugal transfer protein [Salmonella enterica subsp. enterica serovar Tennessee]EBS2547737.1 conjugal transfer protein [Salmonella enterica subsp. enterica serovar Muenster]EBU7818440.1 conjugal transfer protein [Salmonella enterica subsp. ente